MKKQKIEICLSCLAGKCRLRLVCLAILMMALIFQQGCGSDNRSGEIALEKAVRAERADARIHALPELFFFPGRVKSKVSIMLAAKMPGYVSSLPFEIGDFVKKGELLISLDDRDIRSEIAALKESSSAMLQQQTALKARFAYAEATFNRIKKLHNEGSATQDEFDRISSEKAALAGQVSAMEARIRQVRARLKEAENQLRYVAIRAPVDGWLIDRNVDQGAFVMPGVPLLQFESSGDGTWFAAQVDETLISKVKPGMPVSVFISAENRMIDTVISQAAPRSNPASHTFSILADISLNNISSGLFGRIFIRTGTSPALLVPCSAVVDRGGIKGLYVVDHEDRLHWRVIKAGNRWIKKENTYALAPDKTPDKGAGRCFTQVITGLSPGESVVTSNLDSVSEGCRLE